MKSFSKMLDESLLDKLKRAILRSDIKADGRTPKEIQKQIKGLSDEVLQKWDIMQDKASPLSTAGFQQKIINHELKRRGLKVKF